MSGQFIALEQTCDFLSGYAWSAASFETDPVGLPIIRIQNVDAVRVSDFVYWSGEYDKRFVVRAGDLLLTLSGSFRAVVWQGPDALLNQRIVKLIPKPGYSLDWLLHVLRNGLNTISGLGRHALVSNVALADLRQLKVSSQTSEEQRRIAAILDQTETVRCQRRAALAHLDSLTQSIFLDMFGDPVTNPKGWSVKPVSSLGRVVTGNTPSRDVPEYYGNSVEWIKSDNLNTPHYYLTRATEGLSDAGKAIGRVVPPQSILVTCIAGSPDCIGNAAMADREVAFNQQINAFVPSELDSHFAYAQIVVGKKLIQNASTNGMKGMVSKSRFEAIEFIVPPLPLQQTFATRIQAIESLKTTHRTALAQLDALFASLQQRAFAGEL